MANVQWFADLGKLLQEAMRRCRSEWAGRVELIECIIEDNSSYNALVQQQILGIDSSIRKFAADLKSF